MSSSSVVLKDVQVDTKQENQCSLSETDLLLHLKYLIEKIKELDLSSLEITASSEPRLRGYFVAICGMLETNHVETILGRIWSIYILMIELEKDIQEKSDPAWSDRFKRLAKNSSNNYALTQLAEFQNKIPFLIILLNELKITFYIYLSTYGDPGFFLKEFNKLGTSTALKDLEQNHRLKVQQILNDDSKEDRLKNISQRLNENSLLHFFQDEKTIIDKLKKAVHECNLEMLKMIVDRVRTAPEALQVYIKNILNSIKNEDNESLLMQAVLVKANKSSKKEIVRLLLSLGANPLETTDKKITVLMYAAARGTSISGLILEKVPPAQRKAYIQQTDNWGDNAEKFAKNASNILTPSQQTAMTNLLQDFSNPLYEREPDLRIGLPTSIGDEEFHNLVCDFGFFSVEATPVSEKPLLKNDSDHQFDIHKQPRNN